MGKGRQSHYTLRPSRIFFRVLWLSCVLFLFVLPGLPLAIAWLFCAGITAIASCIYVSLVRAKLRLAKSIVAFRLEDEREITLIQRNGLHTRGKLSKGSLVTPYLVLLNVNRDAHGYQSVLVMPDSMSRDAFRRLRVALRWS